MRRFVVTISACALISVQFFRTKPTVVNAPGSGSGSGGGPSGPVAVPGGGSGGSGATPTQTGKTFLALGDFYTIGESVLTTERFPAQTKDWLQNNSVNMIEPRFIAGTGWTTYVLQNVMGYSSLTSSYDAVTLLIGVNDQYTHTDTAEFRRRFKALLTQSISLAKETPAHVFVLSIPDYSVTPFAASLDTVRIRKEIDNYNSIISNVCQVHGAKFLDITPSTREAKTNRSLLAADGLHPSGLEYRRWAEMLGPMMKTALQ